jgi:hypothetical protein
LLLSFYTSCSLCVIASTEPNCKYPRRPQVHREPFRRSNRENAVTARVHSITQVIMIGYKTQKLRASLALDGGPVSGDGAKASAQDQESSLTRTRSTRGQGEPMMHLNDRGLPSPVPLIKSTERPVGHEGAILRPRSGVPVDTSTTGVLNTNRSPIPGFQHDTSVSGGRADDAATREGGLSNHASQQPDYGHGTSVSGGRVTSLTMSSGEGECKNVRGRHP